VQDLQKAKSANPSEKAKRLASNLMAGFEENMNNDLDVKAAFDELFRIISELHGLMKRARLSAEDANDALSGLHRIDSVLKVIY